MLCVSDSEKVSCENGLVDKVSDDGVVCPSPGCDSSGTIFSGLGVEVLGYNVFRDDQLLRLATPPSSLFKSAFDEISPPLDLRSNFAPPSSSDYQQPSWEQATRTRPDIPFAQILSRRADLSY
ncbi:unnamed protein product [Protopolystoma xenopodis]|uniref:Uncharacterized protein n=1 Tax=Protopolystoma xenopodis TaxID=117903 RepID=A0A448X4X7_9PLAT|nr:unnamed protein product [Protopolystoma xenopodis]